MRHTIHTLIILLATLFASCAKAPINGDLDGMWQLTIIERFDTNGQTASVSMQKDIFWAFQLHLLQFGAREYYARFDNAGAYMRIYDIASASTHVIGDDDKMLTAGQIGEMARFGIYDLDTYFAIERMDDEAMTLRSDSARLTFRKY